MHANHRLNEHLLKELLFSILVKDLESRHRNGFRENHERAVIKLGIRNKHLALEGQLNIHASCLNFVINNNLSSEISSHLEVSVCFDL